MATEKKSCDANFVFILSASALLRIGLFQSGFHDTFSRRVEISNAITSWHRVRECVTLWQKNISPYQGDICHQPPLVVQLFLYVSNVHWFFIFMDVAASVILFYATKQYTRLQLAVQQKEKKNYAKDISILLLDQNKLANIPVTVMAVYLFNPYSLVSCIAQSTVVLNNLVNATILFMMLQGWFTLAAVCVAISCYLSLYPIMLLVPLILLAYQQSEQKYWAIVRCLFTTTISMVILAFSSFQLCNSWGFVRAVYGFVLEAPDLTPNMGLFWYFFLEMFDHFRLFFLWVYQINVFIHIVPLTVVFKKQPVIIFYALLSLMALFKSYSCFGDLSLTIALLPLWNYTYRYMRNVLLILVMFLLTTVLAPGMWHLWIYSGSGNANFFYAVTLAYCTAQVFLLADVLYAYLRYEHHLVNGISPKTEDGKDGVLVLK